MTRKFRRFIFWIFAVFFVALSIAVSLIAQGWSFDFNTLKIVKTGGIYIKTSVTEARVYINDKYYKSTGGLLSHTTLISGLVPKQYSVFIYKDGYFPWNKTIEVRNGLVMELSHIILLPINLNKTKITEVPAQQISEFSVKDKTIEIKNNKVKTVKTYDFDGALISNKKFKIATSSPLRVTSPDGRKELFVSENKIWISYISDEKEEPTRKTGETDLVASYEGPIKFFDWFNDSEHVIWYANNELKVAERDDRGDKRYTASFYLDIDSPVFWNQQNSEFYFFELNDEVLVLYKINVGN
ncbi:MAG: PEGA domain-containing protein [Parcubacteria group bacterium]|nr:PEGA domain-containing protein [Parcubacteria group bacterium]